METKTKEERLEKVNQILEEHIRPGIRMDGGDIQLLDVEGSRVVVSLHGACGTCPSSLMTLQGFVQRVLSEQLEEDIEIICD